LKVERVADGTCRRHPGSVAIHRSLAADVD
jgi:hypothetical protein